MRNADFEVWKEKMQNDLKDRTRRFAIEIIKVVEEFPKNRIADVIGKQILKSGTSVGANYRAACRARSRAEFISKMGIVEEETDETLYWLELLLDINLGPQDRIQQLMDESDEINTIVVTSIKTARGNLRIR